MVEVDGHEVPVADDAEAQRTLDRAVGCADSGSRFAVVQRQPEQPDTPWSPVPPAGVDIHDRDRRTQAVHERTGNSSSTAFAVASCSGGRCAARRS